MIQIGLLILRLVVGLLFAGHGAQKLFGWFGGPGMARHTGFMESLGLHPPQFWAYLNALSEFLGGLAFALGFLTPLAAAGLVGSMLVAILQVHGAKGFWNTQGGIEFPLVLAVVAFVIGITGPGIYALDQALAIRWPETQVFLILFAIMLVVILVGIIVAGSMRRRVQV